MLANRKCLPKSNAKTTLLTLIAQTSIAFLHHGHKLTVIYPSILKDKYKANLKSIEERIELQY